MGSREGQELQFRKRGLVFARTEISPDEAADLTRRIRQKTDVLLGAFARGSGIHRWHREATPVGGELPAVIGAADAALFIAAKEQIGAAMRTARGNQTDRAVGGTKCAQILAENGDPDRRAIGF